MTDYSHLTAPSFDLRKVMAAHYLLNCRRIVEVGGGRNPIYNFINDGFNRQYWIVDPECEPVYLPGVQHCKMGIEDFNFQSVPTHQYNSGLCLLGLELAQPHENALNNIVNNIPRFHMIVTDYVDGNDTAFEQHEKILEKAVEEGFTREVELSLTFHIDAVYESRVNAPSASFYRSRVFSVMIQEQ